MRARIEQIVDGIKYAVVESDASPNGFIRFDLKRWVPTYRNSGAWHNDMRVILPLGSTVTAAAKRLLGE